MKAYSTSSEEDMLARNLLKDWAAQGFITKAQYDRIEQEIVCDLRRTNIFLRLVLFFFTLIIVGGVCGLLLLAFVSNSARQPVGLLLLVVATMSYAGAEFVVSHRFYRYGIEEGLAVCSVALLCTGIFAILSTGSSSPNSNGTEFLVPAVGAIASLWIWHRFGLAYAFIAAMAFVAWLSGCWTTSHSAQRQMIAGFYAAGLIVAIRLRSRCRFDYLRRQYSIIEAILWLGIYLTLNLQLSSIDLLRQWWNGSMSRAGFPTTFYWATWILTWCIPCASLVRGFLSKDRLVIAVGGVTAILTLVTNKPYLGAERHSWDPMLLGALLVSIALFLHRWFSTGPNGIRHGITARRLSGMDKRSMDALSVAFGLTSAHIATANPQTSGPAPRFGGGDFGGGGAASDF